PELPAEGIHQEQHDLLGLRIAAAEAVGWQQGSLAGAGEKELDRAGNIAEGVVGIEWPHESLGKGLEVRQRAVINHCAPCPAQVRTASSRALRLSSTYACSMPNTSSPR